MDTGVVLRILVLIGVFTLLFLPTVWAIRDVAHRSFPGFKAKAIWFAIVTLLPPIGALIYIVMGRPRVGTEAEGTEGQDVEQEEASE